MELIESFIVLVVLLGATLRLIAAAMALPRIILEALDLIEPRDR